MSKKYRKKPVVIEAKKLPFKADESGSMLMVELMSWMDSEHIKYEPEGIKIKTLEGTMLASWGDYIIKGIKGEFYPCKPDIFEATYEEESEG